MAVQDHGSAISLQLFINGNRKSMMVRLVIGADEMVSIPFGR